MAKTYQEPNFTTDDAAAYKAKLDENAAAHNAITGQFAAHEAAVPDMTVVVSGGRLNVAGKVIFVPEQSTAPVVAPLTDSRIDKITINTSSGLLSVVEGDELAVPVEPVVPFGFISVASIFISTNTTAITNNIILEERISVNPSYEEGSWEPTLQDSSFSDNEGQVYGFRFGHFVRIGRVVNIGFTISLTDMGTLSSSLVIAGLPFKVSNLAFTLGSVAITSIANLGLALGNSVVGNIRGGGNVIELKFWGLNANDLTLNANLNAFNFNGNNPTISGYGSYIIE